MSLSLHPLLFSLLLTLALASPAHSHTTLHWPTSLSYESDVALLEDDLLERETGMDRRSLYYIRHYYISYGALAANRIPCPARSGRSYYTHNCYKARGQVHPYTRGCSTITRCRR